VRVRESEAEEGCELLIAVHAEKSAAAVLEFRARHPGRPIVVALAGTDLYGAGGLAPATLRSIRLATRLVVLQPLALGKLPLEAHAKTRVVLQSAARARVQPARDERVLEVCLLAHLRPVKDPLLAARATRLLPANSKVRVVHYGAALDPALAEEARGESATNPRYSWRGETSHAESLRALAGARLALVTSLSEGGSNAVSEALAASVPLLSTRIDGSVGLLGTDYPGLFEVGDAPALAALLARAEEDPAFLADLEARCARIAPRTLPEREREAWRGLLAELAEGGATKHA